MPLAPGTSCNVVRLKCIKYFGKIDKIILCTLHIVLNLGALGRCAVSCAETAHCFTEYGQE